MSHEDRGRGIKQARRLILLQPTVKEGDSIRHLSFSRPVLTSVEHVRRDVDSDKAPRWEAFAKGDYFSTGACACRKKGGTLRQPLKPRHNHLVQSIVAGTKQANPAVVLGRKTFVKVCCYVESFRWHGHVMSNIHFYLYSINIAFYVLQHQLSNKNRGN